MRTLILLACLALAAPAHAYWLQYDTTSRVIRGAFAVEADARPLAGTDLFEVSGVALSALVWPPPSGCAQGRKDWTALSAGPALPLILDPARTFFRCHEVSDAKTLYQAMKEDIDQAVRTFMGQVTPDLLSVLAFATNICDGNNGATCNSIRSNNVTIGGKIGTLAEVLTLQNTIMGIYTAAQTLKGDKGW